MPRSVKILAAVLFDEWAWNFPVSCGVLLCKAYDDRDGSHHLCPTR